MRPLLAYNGYSSGGARAYLLSPYSYQQLGGIVGSVESFTSSIQHFIPSKICQIENTIYVLHAGTIKKLEPNGTWTVMASLTSPAVNQDIWATMYPVFVAGSYYLAVVYPTTNYNATNAVLRGATYNIRTGVLTTSSEVTVGGGAGVGLSFSTFGTAHVVGGSLYLVFGNYNAGSLFKVIVYNVAGASLSFITSGASTAKDLRLSTDMFLWKNELWFASYADGTANFVLYKLIGSSIVSQVTIQSSVAWSTESSKPTLFGIGDYLYAMALTSAGTWRMYRINQALSVTEITSSVISGFTGQDLDSNWTFIVDQHTLATSPEYFLMFRGDLTNGPISFYKWINDSTPLSFLGTAGESNQRLIVQAPKNGGGHFMYTVGEMNIQIEGAVTPSNIPGNVNVGYRIYESTLFPSGTLAQIKFFYNKNNLETATNRCSLTSPSPNGSMLDSYTITNAVVGSGVLNTIQWRAQVDGFSVGDGALIVAQASGIY